MESWRRTGDFRERQRRAERATTRRGVLQRSRANAQTHEAIEKFEEVLVAEQEKQNREIDDLPPEADANSYGNNYRSMGTATYTAAALNDGSDSEDGRFDPLRRSHSEIQVRSDPITNDPCMMRPPSPLSYYDYGCVSLKPRSVFAQHKQRLGESTRAKYRQSHPGFYFPGPQFKQGPYGFSVLDPCLLAPRSWPTSSSKGQTLVRQENDLGDIRPLSSEDLGHRRNRVAAPHISDSVRTTRAHSERALMSFKHMDNHREEKLLEQVRFEKGMYEARWRDPMLDTKGALPEECPEEAHDWLDKDEEHSSMQALGSRILFGLQGCLRNGRSKITSLFNAENRTGPKSVLEPKDFLRGLVRLGIMEDGELTEQSVVEAMCIIDPNFDGRVNIPVLARAVNAAHKVQGERTQVAQNEEKMKAQVAQCTYCDSLPVEIVKVDRESRSLFNFERSFEKFRAQQRILLDFHHELGH